MVLIHRCREALAAQIRPVFLLHDLTDPQWRVLRVLEAAGPVDVTELSRLTFLLPPSLSRILRDLSARGLIAREVAADDGRRFLHALTPKGCEVIAEVAPYFEPIFHDIEARYPPERIRQLNADLRGLLEALQARGDPDPGES
jgi:homoprotocatechuate degradation regulator HpaR